MKTPDDIKKGLRCFSRDRTHTLPCSDCEYHGQGLPPCRTAVHEDALAYIQKLEADNAQQARCIENMTDKLNATNDALLRWISVEERLPENFVSVIGYLPIDDKEGLPPTREVYRTEKGWFAPSLGELCIVTHWMSMPEWFREV